eukprot:TRINITY_DN7457_c0_g2_i4.p1 TRINITY_DN7457_c0_g2~~TRINITY_DN7457_c0_g2_i4.p1  ORF type:complete len:659 (+),score=190.63 TRINITY_DN7457_c0_g2_i4:163-2139(+)
MDDVQSHHEDASTSPQSAQSTPSTPPSPSTVVEPVTVASVGDGRSTRKRRSDVSDNNTTEGKGKLATDPAEGTSTKRARKMNPIYADFDMDKKTTQALMGQDPAGKRKEDDTTTKKPPAKSRKKSAPSDSTPREPPRKSRRLSKGPATPSAPQEAEEPEVVEASPLSTSTSNIKDEPMTSPPSASLDSSSSAPSPPSSMSLDAPAPPSKGKAKKPPAAQNRGRKPKATPPAAPPRPASAVPQNTPAIPPGRAHRTKRKRLPTGWDVQLSPSLLKAGEILTELWSHDHAWPFVKPVDPVELNIPDYFDIIKHPMDLGTIKSKLNSGAYENIKEFGEDVRLVFANTRTYNQPGSDVVYMANVLSDRFEPKYTSLEKEAAALDAAVPAHEPDDDFSSEIYYTNPPLNTTAKIEKEINKLSSQLKEATEEIKRLKEEKKGIYHHPAPPHHHHHHHASKSKGRPRDDTRVMTFEEKRRLSISINALPGDRLGKVIQIIHERNPNLAQSASPDEIEIDIDALDTVTLRHLERYVRTTQPSPASRAGVASRPPPPVGYLPPNARQSQAEAAASGTQERIQDVKRQLEALNKSLNSSTSKLPRGRRKKGAGPGEEDDAALDTNPLFDGTNMLNTSNNNISTPHSLNSSSISVNNSSVSPADKKRGR